MNVLVLLKAWSVSINDESNVIVIVVVVRLLLSSLLFCDRYEISVSLLDTVNIKNRNRVIPRDLL